MLRLSEKLQKISDLPKVKQIGSAIVLLLLLTGLIGYRPLAVLARGQEEQGRAQLPPRPVAEGQFFYDDVTVSEGEIYRGDVVVYTGDVSVESGGAIHGNLVVSSGDLSLAADSEVHGDVVAFSGDVEVDGHIGGDLVVWSGDIALGAGATVDGDVSLMNGDITRNEGAKVRGNIVAGPKFPDLAPILNELKLPAIPNAIDGVAPQPPPAPTANEWGVGDYLLRLIWRLLGAAVLTGLIVLTSGLVYYARPTVVNEVRNTLTEQRPLSFGVGLAVNVVLTLLIGAAFGTGSILLTICLSPLGLVAGLIFFAINLGGWAAVALEVGGRLLARLQVETRTAVQLLAGSFVITAPLTLAWALGSCFQPVGYLAMLALTALGGGAVLVNRLKLGRGGTALVSGNTA